MPTIAPNGSIEIAVSAKIAIFTLSNKTKVYYKPVDFGSTPPVYQYQQDITAGTETVLTPGASYDKVRIDAGAIEPVYYEVGADPSVDVADATSSTPAELDILDGATLTTTELNRLDDSAEVETIDSGDAISVTKFNTNIDNTTSGAGAITLAACPATMVGKIKTIRMEVDNGDVTLALTNVQGGSAATTATFDAVAEELILVGSAGGKWTVVKEFGVTLA